MVVVRADVAASMTATWLELGTATYTRELSALTAMPAGRLASSVELLIVFVAVEIVATILVGRVQSQAPPPTLRGNNAPSPTRGILFDSDSALGRSRRSIATSDRFRRDSGGRGGIVGVRVQRLRVSAVAARRSLVRQRHASADV